MVNIIQDHISTKSNIIHIALTRRASHTAMADTTLSSQVCVASFHPICQDLRPSHLPKGLLFLSIPLGCIVMSRFSSTAISCLNWFPSRRSLRPSTFGFALLRLQPPLLILFYLLPRRLLLLLLLYEGYLCFHRLRRHLLPCNDQLIKLVSM